jgi:hypothetical protein
LFKTREREIKKIQTAFYTFSHLFVQLVLASFTSSCYVRYNIHSVGGGIRDKDRKKRARQKQKHKLFRVKELLGLGRRKTLLIVSLIRND